MNYNSMLLAAQGPTDERLLAILLIGVIIGAIVLAIVVYLCQTRKQKLQQQQIDANNLLQYRNWQAAMGRMGLIQPISSPLLLARGEDCLWMQSNVTLFEVRSVRHSVHTGGSMPIGKGGIRIGRAYSTSESTDEWRPISEGTLYITNKQLYFDGDKQDRKVPLGKISTIKAEASAIEVSSDTRQKSMIFVGCNGNICREIVLRTLRQEELVVEKCPEQKPTASKMSFAKYEKMTSDGRYVID